MTFWSGVGDNIISECRTLKEQLSAPARSRWSVISSFVLSLCSGHDAIRNDRVKKA